MFKARIEPTIEEAEEIIKKNIGNCFIIVGRCYVLYKGRASSKLGLGSRIAIIKKDGSFLIHRQTGYKPINWMPGHDARYFVKKVPETEFNQTLPEEKEDKQHLKNILEIRFIRQKPPESIKVFFEKIYIIAALSLTDSGEFSLYASEKEMQKAIFLEPSLLEEGFKPISYEKRVEPGFVDVYGVDTNGKLVVVEIKRKTAGKESALQLAKYIDALKKKANRKVRGILIAPNLAKGVQRMLVTLGLEFKAIDPKKCAKILQRWETKKLVDFFKES